MLGFLHEVDLAAPWFAVSGSLNIPCWDKLGGDIERAQHQNQISGGTLPLWRIIRACLEDKKFAPTVEQGRAALEEVKEERSAKSENKSETASDSESESESKPEPTSDEESRRIERHFRKIKLKDKNDGSESEVNPPPYNPSAPIAEGGTSFHTQTWLQASASGELGTFPVFVDNAGNRYHEPLDFKTVKNLAEAVRTYGINAAFTIAVLESFQRFAMTPEERFWDYSSHRHCHCRCCGRGDNRCCCHVDVSDHCRSP